MFHYTKTLLRSGGYITYSYFSFMRPFAKNPTKKDINWRYNKLRKVVAHTCSSMDADFIIEGKENVLDTASCYISNHNSDFDPLLLISIMEKPTTFVAKKEIEKFPFIGKCTKTIDGLFMDRDNLKQSLKVMLKIQDDLSKKKDKNWVIFAEGTRNKDCMANLLPFHSGTFRAPMKAKVPIIPTCIYGGFRIFALKPQYKKYPIHIAFLKPIMPNEYENMSTEQLAKLVQDRIQAKLTFDIRSKDHIYMAKLKNKKYRFNKVY